MVDLLVNLIDVDEVVVFVCYFYGELGEEDEKGLYLCLLVKLFEVIGLEVDF